MSSQKIVPQFSTKLLSRVYFSTNGLFVLQPPVTSTTQFTYYGPPSVFASLDDFKTFVPSNQNALVAPFWFSLDYSGADSAIYYQYIRRSEATESERTAL